MRRLADWLRARYREVAEGDHLDLALRVGLLFLLLKPTGAWYLQFPVFVLSAWGLLSRRVARSPWLWLLLTYLAGVRVILQSETADNHVYLVAYWCLAVFCALTVPASSDRTLAISARLLIGLAFVFAALWKGVLSADYMDGTFFRGTLLFDGRFREFAMLFGGQTGEDHLANARALAAFRSGFADPLSVTLVEPQRQAWLGFISTWWTLLIEVLVGVLFLIHRRSAGRWVPMVSRDASLLLFIWTTYAFATVTHFGWLLAVLGLTQCEPERRFTRGAYLVTFVAVYLYTVVPWARWLASW